MPKPPKLGRLDLDRFTVFHDVSIDLSPQLNVVIGTNATGKSHLLKLAYACLRSLVDRPPAGGELAPTKSRLKTVLSDNLRGTFRPDKLGRLATRQRGVNTARVTAVLTNRSQLRFRFTTRSDSVDVLELPHEYLGPETQPVYLPTRELMSIYPGFAALYESTAVEFDQTWRDTCMLLGKPNVRGPRLEAAKALLGPLEIALGGKVVIENDRFYLKSPRGKLEMHLVAEGLRKIATITQLVTNGTLIKQGVLLWDEPEANLNPQLIRRVASVIVELAGQGTQVLIATHSSFLVRELEMALMTREDVIPRFVGLHRSAEDDDSVMVEVVEDSDDLQHFVSHEIEVEQADDILGAM